MKKKHRAKKPKFWIQKAIGKHKGALHKHLGIPKGEKIPLMLLKEAAEEGGKIGKEANLALTLRKMSKRRKKR